MIGSNVEYAANVRIVAASNDALHTLATSGRFRIDLYYRLCVFSIHLPPLRDRRQDIELLAEHFLKKHAPATSPAFRLAPLALAALSTHNWPGNVRELENAIIRAIHLCPGGLIGSSDLFAD